MDLKLQKKAARLELRKAQSELEVAVSAFNLYSRIYGHLYRDEETQAG